MIDANALIVANALKICILVFYVNEIKMIATKLWPFVSPVILASTELVCSAALTDIDRFSEHAH